MARPMLFVWPMSKLVFEVQQKNGSWVNARLGAKNHSEEAHMGMADVAIGGSLFIAAAGFVCFLLLI
jgi:hypothetical protein